jgi:uncharacterized Zn-binding protein involved in type VI secretion
MGAVLKVARLGDPSDHGGVIISSASLTNAEGQLVARVGDLHSCPIPGHGVTPIVSGASRFTCEGSLVALDTSVCGCGASIIATASVTGSAK